MEQKMFCYQCQDTAGCKGCTACGVCGKQPEVAVGLYVYASTETIMKKALKQLGLQKFESKRVDTEEGDILRIDRNGKITRSQYEPKYIDPST
ncbi:hypothetical protein [Ruminococcus flavefaciens]|uniref:Hydroxylamine reductase n=1 Tax=Ruminococcus flavefaciens 007c TaxID=1341157 RepID=W7V2I2_RUMFL|nr:hypothetical protein [Ruminococcus flavefaciens]EWM55180.1 hypothetical protein RF007C_05755 [Ruminococcus flavefaciens 007c]